MKPLLPILTFLLLAGSVSVAQEAKHIGNLAMEEVRVRVFNIGMRRDHTTPTADKEKEVDAAIPLRTPSEHLMKLGITFYLYAYPMNAGDQKIDDVFYYASRKCAQILADRPGSDEGHYLRLMKPICGRDAGESLFYNELIEAQNKLTEQGGADQPATAAESESVDNQKPKPQTDPSAQ